MKKVQHEMNVSVTGIEPISSLLEVLSANYEHLPNAVKEAIQQIEEDTTVYNCEYLLDKHIQARGMCVYVDGTATEGVIYGSRVGRLVQIEGKAPFSAQSFWIVSKGEFICGWGDKPTIEVTE